VLSIYRDDIKEKVATVALQPDRRGTSAGERPALSGRRTGLRDHRSFSDAGLGNALLDG
jgi:hypothetical protein